MNFDYDMTSEIDLGLDCSLLLIHGGTYPSNVVLDFKQICNFFTTANLWFFKHVDRMTSNAVKW